MSHRTLAVLAAVTALIAPAAGARATTTPTPPGLVRSTLDADPQTATGVTAPVLDIRADVLDIVTDVRATDGSVAVNSGSTTTTVTVSADVLFAFDRATLSAAARAKLAEVAQQLKDGGASGTVLVGGHADSKGRSAYNLALSQRRAAAVVAALQPLVSGLPITLQAKGFGDTKPVAPNTLPDGRDNPAGRKLNRRVTIEFGHPER